MTPALPRSPLMDSVEPQHRQSVREKLDIHGRPRTGPQDSGPRAALIQRFVVISADFSKCFVNVGLGDWLPRALPVLYRTVTSPWARVLTRNAGINVGGPPPRVKNEQPDESKDCRAEAINIKRRLLQSLFEMSSARQRLFNVDLDGGCPGLNNDFIPRFCTWQTIFVGNRFKGRGRFPFRDEVRIVARRHEHFKLAVRKGRSDWMSTGRRRQQIQYNI